MTSSARSPLAQPGRRFATTRWSLVRQSCHTDAAPARIALEELCQAYWLPVYAFMRRQTKDVHEAQDLTQGFFVSLLSRDAFANVNPSHGRFRSFLLAAARNFVCNERDRMTAEVRGGRIVLQSLDYDDGERQISTDLSQQQSPERMFERRWAVAILERVMDRLRQEYEFIQRLPLFESLAGHLSGGHNAEKLWEVARQLQMSPEAVRVALHRLRKGYRRVLRDEIAQTINSPDDVDDEIRQLFNALQSG